MSGAYAYLTAAGRPEGTIFTPAEMYAHYPPPFWSPLGNVPVAPPPRPPTGTYGMQVEPGDEPGIDI